MFVGFGVGYGVVGCGVGPGVGFGVGFGVVGALLQTNTYTQQFNTHTASTHLNLHKTTKRKHTM